MNQYLLFVRRVFHTQQKAKPRTLSPNSNWLQQLEVLNSRKNIRANGTIQLSERTREDSEHGFA